LLIATPWPVLAWGLQVTLVSAGLDGLVVCTDAAELHAEFLSNPPHIAILDEALLPGPEIVADLLSASPRCRFVILTRRPPSSAKAFPAPPDVCHLVPPGMPPEQLVELVKELNARPAPAAAAAAWLRETLSPDERRLVSIVAHGARDSEAAALMRCSERQVNKQINGLIRRLKMAGRSELALYGMAGAGAPADSEVPL
jgi:DNA-binding NarL/FixJ family response regulator